MADTLKREGLVYPGNSSAVGGASLPAHTPGPWHHVDQGSEGIIFGPKGTSGYIGTVAQFSAGYGPRRDQRIANALLITAAPDLLEALRAMLSAFRYSGPDADGFIDSSERIARAAIAKALAIDPQATPGMTQKDTPQ